MNIIKIILIIVCLSFISTTCFALSELGDLAYKGESKYYVIGRTDLRRCAQCGGYFLNEINTGAPALQDIYVQKIVLEASIKNVDEKYYRFAPSNEVVIYGKISGSGMTKTIEVSNIYRLLTKPSQGWSFNATTKFFKASDSENLVKLNSNDRYRVADILNTYGQDVSAIQLDWVDYKITSGNSVFTMSENHITGNVTIDYLFISLPDPAFCPMVLTKIQCSNSTVASYTRTPQRCTSFTGCVKKGICPLSVISCPNGYTRNQLPSKINGCPKYYCDPAFLTA